MLYTIFTNELPELTKDDNNCNNTAHTDNKRLFGTNCTQCGTIPCYADDATVVHSSHSRQINQEKLIEHLDNIETFLHRNKLSINKDKTTINEIMIKQKRARINGQPPTIQTVDSKGDPKLITADKSTRLLGGNIADNLCSTKHLENGEKPLLPRLRQQLGALNMLSSQLPKKSRLNLANGLLISKICYLLPVWGGAPPTLLKKIQTILNKAARFVTRCHPRTSTLTLMKKCNWLKIRELVSYMSILAMWNIVHNKSPEQLHDPITIDENYKLNSRPPRLLNTEQSFKHRTIADWNLLPETTRTNTNLVSFK